MLTHHLDVVRPDVSHAPWLWRWDGGSQSNAIIGRKINTPSGAMGATTHSLNYLVVTRSVGPEDGVAQCSPYLGRV